MIKNLKNKDIGLDILVSCDNCRSVTLHVSELNLIEYEMKWLSGITYDVCPECRKTELKPEVSMKISSERKVIENYQIRRAALNKI